MDFAEGSWEIFKDGHTQMDVWDMGTNLSFIVHHISDTFDVNDEPMPKEHTISAWVWDDTMDIYQIFIHIQEEIPNNNQ